MEAPFDITSFVIRGVNPTECTAGNSTDIVSAANFAIYVVRSCNSRISRAHQAAYIGRVA